MIRKNFPKNAIKSQNFYQKRDFNHTIYKKSVIFVDRFCDKLNKLVEIAIKTAQKVQFFKVFSVKNMQFFKVLAKNLPLSPDVFRWFLPLFSKTFSENFTFLKKLSEKPAQCATKLLCFGFFCIKSFVI